MPILHPAVMDSTPILWVLIWIGWVVIGLTFVGVVTGWFRHRR